MSNVVFFPFLLRCVCVQILRILTKFVRVSKADTMSICRFNDFRILSFLTYKRDFILGFSKATGCRKTWKTKAPSIFWFPILLSKRRFVCRHVGVQSLRAVQQTQHPKNKKLQILLNIVCLYRSWPGLTKCDSALQKTFYYVLNAAVLTVGSVLSKICYNTVIEKCHYLDIKCFR